MIFDYYMVDIHIYFSFLWMLFVITAKHNNINILIPKIGLYIITYDQYININMIVH